MLIDVLVGLQWGDEGKGKIIDWLSNKYDVVCRYQGGANAGHTIEFNNNKIVLHTVPSGILNPKVINYIGNGVLIDPISLYYELMEIQKYNPSYKERLYISKNCHLVLPTHKYIDRAFESNKNEKKIGSTLKGIGPAYGDKYLRFGLRLHHIFDSNFKEKTQELVDYHLKILRILNYKDIDNLENEIKNFFDVIEFIKNLKLISYTEFWSIFHGKKILAEGAQGALLDIDAGTYPYVTSSNTFVGGVCNGLMVPPKFINKIIGIFKAYCTRVGEGPFPTEQNNSIGNKLRNNGNEYGSTTGRPRRCGWLDLVALKYAVNLNSVDELIMTKVDVLSDFQDIEICYKYLTDDNLTVNDFTVLFEKNVSPIYKKFNGWNANLNNVKNKNDLPQELLNFIFFIEEFLNKKINYISIGPERNDIISLI